MSKKVLVIEDWSIVAKKIWEVFQGTGVSREVADVLINEVYEKLLKEDSVSPGRLLASFKQRAGFKSQINRKRDLCVVFPESAKIKMDQPVHILILENK